MAIASRPAAEQALEETNAALVRVEDVIDAGEHTERLAKRCAAAVSAATRAWSEAGAPADVPSVDPALLARMNDARREADAAAFQAAGAKAALPKVRAAVDEARAAVSSADSEIMSAVTAVQAAEAEPLLIELEELARKSAPLVARIHALRTILHGKWGSAHRWHKFGNTTLRLEIERRLLATGFRIPSEEEVRNLSNQWANFGERLSRDPDEQF